MIGPSGASALLKVEVIGDTIMKEGGRVMATLTAGAALRQIGALFGRGIVAGQSDGQLLDRFLARRDAVAFEALVARHGPMVLAACRGTLRDPGDVEDAFQATFLVLVRKAGSIRGRDAIGPWLHRVAHRVAVRANIEADRRRGRERRAAEARGAASSRGPREDLRAALHEEIDRLPERLRRPLVLCHLEDMTHAQAASELRMGEATVRRRLAGARDLLRARLGRRGIVPAVPVAAMLAAESASAAMQESWTAVAVRAAMAATFPGGIVTPAASALSRRVSRAILASRLKTYAAWSATALVVCSAWGLVNAGARPVDDGPKAAPRPTPPPKVEARAAEAMIEVRGRVVDPSGKPLAGAGVALTVPSEAGRGESTTTAVARTTSGADGLFRLEVSSARLDDPAADPGWRRAEVVATADGFGFAWTSLAKAREGEVTLRLVPDAIPLHGRVLDLEGRPVAGARVAVSRVATPKGGDLTAYLNTVRDGTEDGNGRLLEDHWFGPIPGRAGSATTDAEGRFTFEGFGRERLVEMTAEAPAIEHVTFMAMTRDAEAVGGSGEKSIGKGSGRVHGARFDLVVPPGRSIVGVVRDKATHEPIPGMFVGHAKSLTDADGRFVASGFAKGKRYELFVTTGRGQPYFVTCSIVPDTPGLGPITADVECVRGIPFRLKLTDKATGKPVAGEVSYSPVYPNKWTREVLGFEPINGVGTYGRAFREPDGTYSGGVLPGPGAIFVRMAGKRYRPASVDPHEFFTGKPGGTLETDGEYGNRRTIMTAHGTGFVPTPQAQFQAIVLTNAPEGSGPLTLAVALEAEDRRAGTILGPDGQALVGAVVDGLGPMDREPSGPLTSAEFRVEGLVPGLTRRLTFTHEARRLSGLLLLRGDEPGPFVVRLRPWATLTGRLVDEEGKPRQGVRMIAKDWQAVLDDPSHGLLPSGLVTDVNGWFRFEGLVAGLKYDARLVNVKDDKGYGVVFDDLTLAPGESRDLGDVRAKPDP